MNKIIKFGLGILFISLPFIAKSSDIDLEYGVNFVDFNGDGIQDIVIKSKHILNNTTPMDIVTVYIKGQDNKVYIVPSIYADILSLYNSRIKNTDIKISDFKFIKKNERVILLSLEKMGNNLLKPTTVRFSSYTIGAQKVHDETQFKWIFSSSCVTKTPYLSVDEAFSDACIDKILNE